MDPRQFVQTFIAESRERLEELEGFLLTLEAAPDDTDTLHALFRVAHTIKGSAGVFGFESVVRFTHVVENVLDRLREGKLHYNADLAGLLLGCRDHISAMIDAIADSGSEPDDAGLAARGTALLEQLRGWLGETAAAPASTMPQVVAGEMHKSGGGPIGSDCWHLSLRFGTDVIRHGMDPLSFFRYMKTVGELVHVTTLTDHLPAGAAYNPESLYFGWEIDYRTQLDRAQILGIFEWVSDESTLRLIPPHSQIPEYITLIHDLPEGPERLGEILVASGILTAQELANCLEKQQENQQAQADASPQQAPPQPEPIGHILAREAAVPHEVIDAALHKQQQVRESSRNNQQHLRVQADKLDRLINLVGELVIAGAATSLQAQRSGDVGLQESASTVSRLVEAIRDSALQLRMVQIGETFQRFNRVVHDVSRELGKTIHLEIGGAETELDKTLVEKIGDPLTHLVRNAIDHGIESAETRRAQGKPEIGTVRLNAYHESGAIVIEVGDDGGGLHRDRILAKAIEKGLASPNQNYSDHDIYQFIFEPGFSTAAQVSNLSGRGVGMDVVKRAITALRGTAELHSEVGAGTTVRIRLPLTLAIIDGFHVGVGEASYVVPLDMVKECIEIGENERDALGQKGYLNLRGEVLPLLRLRERFRTTGGGSRRENVVVVEFGNQRAGLVVDQLHGQFQTVIKPLGRLFAQLKGIGGSTILGTGEVALILDVPALIQSAIGRESERFSARRERAG